MPDKQILDKDVDLDRSCLKDDEKKQVMDMLYKYKEAFSLRDEIGTCPSIEVEDKKILDKEMKRLCYLGILKEGFSAYSSPVMLISGKIMKDKRVVTDFRH